MDKVQINSTATEYNIITLRKLILSLEVF